MHNTNKFVFSVCLHACLSVCQIFSGLGLSISELLVYGRYEQRYMDDLKIKAAEKVKEEMERRYMDDLKTKAAEKVKETEMQQVSAGETSSKTTDESTKPKSKDTKPKASEQDLDAFLLGDIEDGDDGPGTRMNHSNC